MKKSMRKALKMKKAPSMKKTLKKVTAILIIVLVAVETSGCSAQFFPRRIEINQIELIRVAGIDKSPNNPENIMITVASKRSRPTDQTSGTSGTQTSSSQEALILVSEGRTVMEATRKFSTFTDKQVFWGYIDHYIIGEEAAREDIQKYLDFIVREHEARLNSYIYVAKGTTAREIIEQCSRGNYFISDLLDALVRDISLLSTSSKEEIIEFMGELDSPEQSACIPVLYLSPKNGIQQNGENQPNMDVILEGFGIIKDFKLAIYVDSVLSRGFNFIKNRVESGSIDVKDSSGRRIGLEIIDARTNVVPVFDGNRLKEVLIKTELATNISEVESRLNVFDEEELNYLTRQQSETIKNEMIKVIEYAQENNIDFVGIFDNIRLKHPIKWISLEKAWDKIFPSLKISVEVKSRINRTYDIRESTLRRNGRESR